MAKKRKNLPKRPNKLALIIFVLAFGAIASVLIFRALAAPAAVNLEAESGTATSPAAKLTDSTASGGGYVQFKATSSSDNCGGSGAPAGYTALAFCDDFNGTSLNLSKWRPNKLGSDTQITGPYNDDMRNCEDPAQVKINNGNAELILVANTKGSACKDKSGGTAQFASGLIETSGDYTFQYGYAEARMYMPGTTSACYNWPGFWTDGRANGSSWPYFLESDIMECLGNGSPQATVHYYVNGHVQTAIGGLPSGVSRSGWHIFAAKYEPSTKNCSGNSSTPDAVKLTYYYDNKQVGNPLEVCYKNTGQYLILQNDIGTEHGGPEVVPNTVLVDYARVWK